MTRRTIRRTLERLLILTLSVEEASDAGDSVTVRQLLEQRNKLIGQLEGTDLSEYSEVSAKVVEGDERLIRKLAAEMKLLTSQLTRHSAAGKAKVLYTPVGPDGPQLLEHVG